MLALFLGLAATRVLMDLDHLASAASLSAEPRKRPWITGLLWGLGHRSGLWIVGLMALVPLTTLAAEHSADLTAQIEQLRAAKDSLLKTSPDSPLLPEDRAAFQGLAYYPIDLRYRLVGELHVYGRQRQVDVLNTDGTTTPLERFGRFVSAFDGKDFWLEVYRSLESGDIEVFFKDSTNGEKTYAGGRYARLISVGSGSYVLDFNNAYNPYCDYNIAYICPLPPLQNHLSFAVEVGELKYGMNLAD